ncbi:MAG: PBP1A family penicillin-binding protein [Kofleriaceae bacterium]
MPAAPVTRAPRRRRRLRALSILRLVTLLVVYGASLGAAGLYFAIGEINTELPADLSALVEYEPSRKSIALSTDGEEIGAFSIENRKVVPLERLPAHVVAAFLSAEDRRFWQHGGFDPIGIVRAAIRNFGEAEVKQGGSTITQQIIKQTLLEGDEDVPPDVFSPEEEHAIRRVKKYQRKMKELVLAVRLERELSKAEILSIYLNHVYLGAGAYGVGAAAEAYFGKDVENLTIAEAALLAGVVAAPSKYAPTTNIAAARVRQREVLRRMNEDGYISLEELASARAEGIALVREGDVNHLAAPYFVEHLRKQATHAYGNKALFKGGLRFYTTLDSRSQRIAENALARGLETLDRKLGFRGPIGHVAAEERAAWIEGPPHPYRLGTTATSGVGERVDGDTVYAAMITALPRSGVINLDLGPAETTLSAKEAQDLRAWRGDGGARLDVGDLLPVRLPDDGSPSTLAQTPAIQGALVAMEPATGRIVAMVGGYDWSASQLNRVTQAHRPVGSSIKPFIYGSAIAAGKTEIDRIYDGAISVPTATGYWSPSNYDGRFSGWVTIRTALARSLNTVAVQLLLDVGLDRVIEVMRGFGITSDIPRHVSISLGTPDLTLLEMAGGYAGIASGGRRVTPRIYDLVTDASGAVLEDLRDTPPGPQVLPADATYVLVDMMRGAVERGTARAVLPLGRPTAGKTGTGANFKDVWFIGFTADLLCGVWIGRDDATPIGDKITGGGAAAPSWLDFMQRAHPDVPPRPFPVPPGVTFARVREGGSDPAGPGGSAAWVPFARGTLPARFAGKAPTSFDAAVPAPPVP